METKGKKPRNRELRATGWRAGAKGEETGLSFATSGWLYEILMPLNCEVRKPRSEESKLVLGERCGGRRKHKLEVLASNSPGAAIVSSGVLEKTREKSVRLDNDIDFRVNFFFFRF